MGSSGRLGYASQWEVVEGRSMFFTTNFVHSELVSVQAVGDVLGMCCLCKVPTVVNGISYNQEPPGSDLLAAAKRACQCRPSAQIDLQ